MAVWEGRNPFNLRSCLTWRQAFEVLTTGRHPCCQTTLPVNAERRLIGADTISVQQKRTRARIGNGAPSKRCDSLGHERAFGMGRCG